MRRLRTVSGRTLTEQEQEDLVANAHRADWVVEFRGEGPEEQWEPLEVVEVAITASQVGVPWTIDISTYAESVLRDDGEGARISYPQPDVTPWGCWMRVAAHLSQPGQLQDDPAVCPLGVYRVETVTAAGGGLRITGRDYLAQLECDRVVPLSQQRIAPGSSRATLLSALVSGAWAAGSSPPGTVAIDNLPSGTTPASGATTNQYDLERQDLCQALLGATQQALVANLTTTGAMYRCVPTPRPLTDPTPVGILSATSRYAPALQALEVRRDRSGVLNVASCDWTLKTSNASRPRRTTVKLTGSVDGTTPVQLGRRFGTQSDRWDGSQVHSEATAIARCEDLIESRLLEATTFTAECSPYWGLEIGDCLQIEDFHGEAGRAWVREWTMSSDGRPWRVVMQPANLVDSTLGRGNSTTATREIAELVEYNEWRPIYSPHVAESCRTKKGWHATGATLSTDGKTAISAKATATGFEVYTDKAYSTGWGVAQAKIAVGKQPDAVRMRVLIGDTPGPWRSIAAGKSGTIRSGEILCGTGTWRVALQVTGATVGHIYWVNELTVEVPK